MSLLLTPLWEHPAHRGGSAGIGYGPGCLDGIRGPREGKRTGFLKTGQGVASGTAWEEQTREWGCWQEREGNRFLERLPGRGLQMLPAKCSGLPGTSMGEALPPLGVSLPLETAPMPQGLRCAPQVRP